MRTAVRVGTAVFLRRISPSPGLLWFGILPIRPIPLRDRPAARFAGEATLDWRIHEPKGGPVPKYQVECVRRETGEPSIREYDAADARTAARYANEDGFVAGAVSPILPQPPAQPVSTFRPTFKAHLTPKLARLSSLGAMVFAAIAPMVVVYATLQRHADPSTDEAIIEAVISGVVSILVFGTIALYARMIAEFLSIQFDIYRLLREISDNLKE